MSKRLICEMSAGFIFGVAAAEFWGWQIWAGVILYAYVCIRDNLKAKRGIYSIVLALCFGIGYGRYHFLQMTYEAYAPLLVKGQQVIVQGEIVKKETKENQDVLSIKNSLIQVKKKNYSCNQINIYLDAGSYSIGDIICVKGSILPFQKARNQGNFDAESYYRSLLFDASVIGEKVIYWEKNEKRFDALLQNIKERLQNTYLRCMKKEDAGICSAMVLGDKSILPKEVKSLYQQAGISHILAISGLHVSIVGMACYLFIRKRGISFLLAGIVAGGIVYCYGQMSGFGISTQRAVFMFLLLLYARFRGRTYDLATALAFVGMGMLWSNPFMLKNAGFLLSFLAVLGIVVSMMAKEKAVFQKEVSAGRKAYDKLKETLRVSLWIQLLTIPMMASFFFQIPLYGLIINLFVLPLAGVLLGSAVLGGIAGCISIPLGEWILLPCHFILAFYEYLCQLFIKLPYAELSVGKLPTTVIFFWYLLLLFLYFIHNKGANLQIPSDTGGSSGKKKSMMLLGIYFSLALLLFLPKEQGFEMTALDVGQGDGIYLRTKTGQNLFIDGGSSSVKNVGEYRILPFLKSKGISGIDYWFVSHSDVDHISGLEELIILNYPIKNIVVSEYMVPNENWERVLKEAKKYGVGIVKMKAGEVFREQGEEGEYFHMQALFPDAKYTQEDANAMSLVLQYREGDFSMIFTGDISSKEEEYLLKSQEVTPVTVLKAAHHGSKFSNSREFLERLKPKVTLISCGEGNRYGHPANEAVANIKNVNSHILDTRFTGGITIKWDRRQKKYICQTYLPSCGEGKGYVRIEQ